jgi:hypothetical protein
MWIMYSREESTLRAKRERRRLTCARESSNKSEAASVIDRSDAM